MAPLRIDRLLPALEGGSDLPGLVLAACGGGDDCQASRGLFDAACAVVTAMTGCERPFAYDNASGDAEPRATYAPRGGAMFVRPPCRSTVANVDGRLPYDERCGAVVRMCRDAAATRLLDGKRRVVVVWGACGLPGHAQDALCRVVEAGCVCAFFVLAAASPARIRAALLSRLTRVSAAGTPLREGIRPKAEASVGFRLDKGVRAAEAVRIAMAWVASSKDAAAAASSARPRVAAAARAALAALAEEDGRDGCCARVAAAFAEADHALAQMDELCADGAACTPVQRAARLAAVAAAAVAAVVDVRHKGSAVQ